jgi:hypothetical protein
VAASTHRRFERAVASDIGQIALDVRSARMFLAFFRFAAAHIVRREDETGSPSADATSKRSVGFRHSCRPRG